MTPKAVAMNSTLEQRKKVDHEMTVVCGGFLKHSYEKTFLPTEGNANQ